jgi:tRNA A37 threonylcarbamoyladenosine modification protein TsaB
MADVLGIEVAGVCSLDILARQSSLTLPVAVATDARRKEIYWALYDGPAADGSRRRLEGPAVDRPTDAPGSSDAAAVEYPSAEVLAFGVATGTLPVVAPDPLYLRRPDVTMSGGPKSVLPK